MLGLAGLGLADSAYLTWYHYAPAVRACVLVRGCETVNASPYAMLGPLPVALVGLAGYSLLALLLALRQWGPPALRDPAGYAVYGLSVVGTGFALYLTAVEVFLLRALCTWCLLSAASIAGLCVLASVDMADRATRSPAVGPRPGPGPQTAPRGRPPRR
jgi:uncharacterized membrane protein